MNAPQKVKFFQAVRNGDLIATQRLVESDVSLLTETDDDRSSPILAALQSGNRTVVDFLARKALDALTAGLIARNSLYGIVHDIGEAQLMEAEDEIAALLDDEDPDLRYISVMVLTFHWDRRRYRLRLEKMLIADLSKHVRAVSARGIGHLLRETKDYLSTKLLLKKLDDESEDGYVRLAAYDSLRSIWLTEAEATQEIIQSASGEGDRFVRELDELTKARGRSPKDSERIFSSWETDWGRRVNWDFVARIRREVNSIK